MLSASFAKMLYLHSFSYALFINFCSDLPRSVSSV